jgi:hypothetical protein
LKLGRVVIAGSIAAAALWIEHGHRTVTDAPAASELDALVAARACPDNENKPYTANCLAFLQGGAASQMQARDAAERAAAPPPSAAKDVASTPAACADTDAVPYSANCIAFMTGWFWRPASP